MVKKPKSPSCSPSWCTNHLFQLSPLKPGLHFKKVIKIRLCPKLNKYSQLRFSLNNHFESTLPLLNLDRKHYTPLFVREEQKKYYAQHDERAQAAHHRLQEMQEQDESHYTIYEPKASNEPRYCSVCDKGYTDYRQVFFSITAQHIQSHAHKKALDGGIYTRFIKQIQSQFKKEIQKNVKTTLAPLESIREENQLLYSEESAFKEELPKEQESLQLMKVNSLKQSKTLSLSEHQFIQDSSIIKETD